MSSASALRMSPFNQTLHTVTAVKLNELEIQKSRLHTHYAKVLDDAQKTVNLRERLRVLYEGIANLRVAQNAVHFDLDNVEAFVIQAEQDPSISQHLLEHWIEKLTEEINHGRKRFDYSFLFGRLLTEWLDMGGSAETPVDGDEKWIDVNSTGGDGQSVGDIASGRKERVDQRKQMEDLIFQDHPINVGHLRSFLDDLFVTKKTDDKEWSKEKDPFVQMQESLNKFGEDLIKSKVTVEEVIWTIKGFNSSDLLSEDKMATLREVKENSVILEELASVMTIMLSRLSQWQWPKEGVPLQFRRHLNGKYRSFMDEDLLNALFLHYLGVKWAVELKTQCLKLYRSSFWRHTEYLTKKEKETRKTMMYDRVELFPPALPARHIRRGGKVRKISIASERRHTQENEYFMAFLPNTHDEIEAYDPSDTAKNEQEPNKTPQAAMIKQNILHLLATEARLSHALHPDRSFTVVRTDIEWFGPSIPHAALLEVVRFFGVPDIWINFFRTFLRAPLYYDDMKEPRTRVRGVPISHSLSDFMSEALLFVMDAAVNKETGIFLYRMHDDFWFADVEAQNVAGAWGVMNKYMDLVGLRFNKDKTGSVAVDLKENNTMSFGPSPLPQSPVKWGFLRLGSDALYHIDQDSVSKHITEMSQQLKQASPCVFQWVNVYNRYMCFFIRNFGEPAMVLGRQHTEQIISTLRRILLELFPEDSGNPVTYLTKLIRSRFGVVNDESMSDAWMHWPMSAGGLGLLNVFANMFALQSTLRPLASGHGKVEETENFFVEALARDQVEYKTLKTAWEGRKGELWRELSTGSTKKLFPSFSEFCKGREVALNMSYWHDSYVRLLKQPEPASPTLTSSLQTALEKIQEAGNESKNPISTDWNEMSPYWRWILCHYGGQVLQDFGSVAYMNRELIPFGMISALKSARVKWD